MNYIYCSFYSLLDTMLSNYTIYNRHNITFNKKKIKHAQIMQY